MAQHPSLRSSGKSKQHRSVLKRFEKIEILKKKGLWKEGEDSVFGLPKVKVLRFKVKKEKAQEEAAETPQTPTEEGTSSTEQKSQAQEDKKESKSQKQSGKD